MALTIHKYIAEFKLELIGTEEVNVQLTNGCRMKPLINNKVDSSISDMKHSEFVRYYQE